jgi:hypothetical protein
MSPAQKSTGSNGESTLAHEKPALKAAPRKNSLYSFISTVNPGGKKADNLVGNYS